ncbi:MAG: hypothetical protein E6Q75_06265 [Rheinheimera sp.]|nr:MAG: hypothetical protein E6Q75_06265 [Rheinheimera sp.]
MQNIHFPLLLVYAGSDELLALPDLSALLQFLAQPQLLVYGADTLIDSAGLQWNLDAEHRLSETGRIWSLHELTLLVQRHFFAQDQCCASKIAAADIPALISLVQQDAEANA